MLKTNFSMSDVGVGTRVINYLVDTILVFLLAFAFYKWYSFYVYYWRLKFFPFWMFFHVTTLLYYTVFEFIWSRTPGKWLSISKVRDLADKKPAFYRILIRSVLRLTFIYPFFIPILGKPLHDALSKTRVVEA